MGLQACLKAGTSPDTPLEDFWLEVRRKVLMILETGSGMAVRARAYGRVTQST